MNSKPGIIGMAIVCLTIVRVVLQVIGVLLGIVVVILYIGAMVELFDEWLGRIGRAVGFVVAFPLFPLMLILPWFDAWVRGGDVEPIVFWSWLLLMVAIACLWAIGGFTGWLGHQSSQE